MNEERLYSFLGIIKKAGKLAAGYNNCIFDIKKDKCKLLIIAENASDNTKDKFESLCKGRKLSYFIFGDKERLGSCIGKASMSVLAIKDENMSKVVQSMFE
ncbi:putative ribosomal protein YlxQ [Oxobacter pfennigii]|uniref:Putative ribosomal protein YlxQ n=1 Tax=Oxobacter pfennigii TaxID=36849 RepID=A0A0P8W825_9CLOT|nr:ribosomal L7Ae/L30e/S12e/Gadd45 family protein [Oxobacter pfennigii]KPU43903.1 putative ribosomal protein YlxQ [Oxobacter pfennigii]